MTQKTHVLFHKNCSDGTGAKFAAWKKFRDKALYTPVQYGDGLPHIEDGSDVYILDFSYSREVLEALRLRSKSILVLDHHKTAQEALEGLPYAQFDMNRSGAVLAWQHFHPDTPIPDLLLDIQDRDLWRWERSTSRDLTAALPLTKNSMPAWDNLATDQEYYLSTVERGKTKSLFDSLAVESALKTVHPFQLEAFGRVYQVGLVNATSLGSDIGNHLCTDLSFDIGMPYFISDMGKLVLSFRSVGDLDTTVISKALGGGGHKNASGATVNLELLAYLYAASRSHPMTIAQSEHHTIVSVYEKFKPYLLSRAQFGT